MDRWRRGQLDAITLQADHPTEPYFAGDELLVDPEEPPGLGQLVIIRREDGSRALIRYEGGYPEGSSFAGTVLSLVGRDPRRL